MAEGAACLVFVLLALSILFTWRMKKQTIRQMMAADTRKRKKRKIYSTRHGNMADILTRKFMFSRKGAFLGILLSLSLGSVIFLGAFYVTENTRRNNELTFQADDGLGSEIEAYLQSNQMTDGIPEEAVAKMQKLPGIRQLHPVRYRMGFRSRTGHLHGLLITRSLRRREISSQTHRRWNNTMAWPCRPERTAMR